MQAHTYTTISINLRQENMKKITSFASPRRLGEKADEAAREEALSSTSNSESALDLTADIKEILIAGARTSQATKNSSRNGLDGQNNNISSSPRKIPAAFTSLAPPLSPESPREKRGLLDFSALSSLSPGRKKVAGLGCIRNTTSPLRAGSAPAGAGFVSQPTSPISSSPSSPSYKFPLSSRSPARGSSGSPRLHSLRNLTGTPPNTARSPKPADGLWGLLGYTSPSDSAVHEAARQGDLPLLQTLLTQNPTLVSTPGNDNATPLMLAAGAGQEETVRYLLRALSGRADVWATDGARRTALHHLARGTSDAPGVALCLLGLDQEGGRPQHLDWEDVEGRTAVHYAASRGNLQVLRFLLGKGANPLAVDKEGLDPLQLLLQEKSRSVSVQSKGGEIERCLQEAQQHARALTEGGTLHSHDSQEVSKKKGSGITCVWECMARLCGEAVEDAGDGEEDDIPQPVEHQLLCVFRASSIPPDASEVYLDNLRRHGYDNLMALRAIASERFKLSLGKYVPDRQDRKRLIKALNAMIDTVDESGKIPEPPLHLPVGEYLKHLLSVSDDLAMRYAEGLRGMNVHTGAQLGTASYDEVEMNLGSTLLQGHKKALKIWLRLRAADREGSGRGEMKSP